VWALAQLPNAASLAAADAALPRAAAAATAAARARAVSAFGAAAITRLGKMKAEEVFHLLAGLNLLGFVPPQTLAPSPRPPPKAGSRAVAAEAAPDAAAAAAAAGAEQAPPPQRRGAPTSFGALLEARSGKVLPFLSPTGAADAAFVVSRMVPPGGMSREWLVGYAKVRQQAVAEEIKARALGLQLCMPARAGRCRSCAAPRGAC
jgi:hypothetical protein